MYDCMYIILYFNRSSIEQSLLVCVAISLRLNLCTSDASIQMKRCVVKLHYEYPLLYLLLQLVPTQLHPACKIT